MKKWLDSSYTQNRELSWLKFNERVLEEAADSSVPLLERLKFAAIFTSNLDEFFMVRVGSLFELSLIKDNKFDNKSFLKPSEQLDLIFAQTKTLYRSRDKVFKELHRLLKEQGVAHLSLDSLSKEEVFYLENYFDDAIYPVLSPQIIDLHHPFPQLVTKQLHVAVMLKHKKNITLGMTALPNALPRIIFLPYGDGLRYILAEELLAMQVGKLFPMYSIIDKAIICVTRNADINPDDEAPELSDDYLQLMRRTLKKRRSLAPVRLEMQTAGDSLIADYLRKRINIKRSQVYTSAAPLDLSYVFSLADNLSDRQKDILLYTPFTPSLLSDVPENMRILDYVQEKDLLLHYPYQNFDIFLQLIKEAVYDESVVSIKITIYRLGKRRAKLMNYLITAAESGKDVTVLMELKARFDEENNINWAEALQEAGCHILYGFEGYKVHSKICLITRRTKEKLSFITQIGTGNYNAQTAAMYTDMSLITSNPAIGHDADIFFKNMGIGNLEGEYSCLLVAPHSLRRGLLAYIEAEKEKALHGEKTRIICKMNALTDRKLIDALKDASSAGVKIDLIVRGICCLRPGIQGKTDNISIKNIVGRFLEHSRIFCFGKGAAMKMFISSADWMTRNTKNRVEVACPIFDDAIKKKIFSVIEIMLKDNVKGRQLQSDGTYKRYDDSGEKIDSQQYFLDAAQAQNDREG
jgi:polyphosphate kinase